MSEHLFYSVAIVPALGIFAQAISWWTRLPSIIVLLLFGVLLGLFVNPDAILNDLSGETGQPIAAQVLFPFVSLAVGIILFEGGLTLRLRDLKGGGVAVFRLVSVGAIVCWVMTTLLAHYLLNMDWRIALLLGAMLVVTGPTVVAPLIRHIRPNKKISSIIKWEGIVIDPIGAIFAVLVFEHVIHVGSERPILSALIMMLNATLVGVAIAAVTASCLVLMVKRYWIPDYLHGVMFLSAAMSSFALSNFLVHESGLVTTTVLGIILANQKFISIEEIVRFKENLGVLLISSLFIVLGSRLDLSQLAGLGPQAFLFVFLLIFLVRPVSTWIALLGTDTSINEKIFLSFFSSPRDRRGGRDQCFQLAYHVALDLKSLAREPGA